MMLIEVDQVTRRHRVRSRTVAAWSAGRSERGSQRWRTVLDAVSLQVESGSTTALVGGSGAGKTTLVRCLIGLDAADGGAIRCRGERIQPGSARRLRWYRRLVQYVPQDPGSSLDPRRTVRDLVVEPLRRLGVDGDHPRMVADALTRVQLDPAMAGRRPGEISGGQAQRVAVARAVVTRPALLVADEPVSGLDLPLRHQVVEVLGRLNRDHGTALLMVSHDLAAVAELCDRVVVLDHGRVVEGGPLSDIFTEPSHPATQRLLAAVPRLPAPPH